MKLAPPQYWRRRRPSVSVLSVIVAVWVSADTFRGVAKAQFAATLIVAAVRPKLGTVEGGKQPSTSGLSADGGKRTLGGGRTVGGILATIGYPTSAPAPRLPNHHSPAPIPGPA